MDQHGESEESLDELAEDINEDELGEDVLTAADVADVVTYTLDWSVQSLLEKIGTTFDINPAFQRRDAWNGTRKSLYIESLMLGLPVPQIVLAEDRTHKGRFIVLDGKQRLVTMKQFAAPNEHFKALSLSKLQFLTQFKGKSFARIQKSEDGQEWLDNFLAQPVRTIVVRSWGKPAVLYQIFVRLNQYSVPLSPQELRQALFPGDFTVWINNRSAASSQIRRARRLKAPDFRMRDAEMLLRAVAFQDHLEDYTGNLRQFLDETCERGNQNWSSQAEHYQALANICEKAIERTFAVFGSNSFYRYEQTEKSSEYIRRFNVAVFDLMCAIFSSAEISDEDVSEHAATLRQAFEKLCAEDQRFQDSIKSTTKTEEATAGRILRYGGEVQKILDIELAIIQRASNLLRLRGD
ncbi:DUF262 domain-containing protein [Nonomuraea sp. C10]|uniref:DUF262 domain-containing protein n=1 Tax=Nonomuraea sp. C10 TaxID=2600577 RepID=UPI0011CD91B4|nr:DUF262 domain-containing protein [Nonomuraea sp. C10]TXK42376.1 DUF262 domain-containing protein [Nonomuraea sp. C10]